MEAIILPNQAQVADLGKNKYSITLEPLYPGYGVTIGNAIRRVLLSSLPGAAVTFVKIKFADHEFSTVPHVKEDVIQIILNLKKLRVKSFSNEPVRVQLKAKGEKKVTAADIKETDQVEIINKDLHIATLDSKTAEFDMELIIEQGRGYVPVEAREEKKQELGMIAIDAIFTPVRSVHFDVTNVRVGQLTNYDKLEVAIETDGGINGQEAANIAAHILVDHFTMMFTAGPTALEQSAVIAQSALPLETTGEISEQSAEKEGRADADGSEIKESTLSNRAKNALIKNKIFSLNALKALSDEEIKSLSGLGEKTVVEIIEFLGRS